MKPVPPLKCTALLLLLAGAVFFVIGYATAYTATLSANSASADSTSVHVGLWSFCFSEPGYSYSCYTIDNSCSYTYASDDPGIAVASNCNEFRASRAFGLLAIIVSFCAVAAAAVGTFKSVGIVDKVAVGLAGAAAVLGLIGFALVTAILNNDSNFIGFSKGYSYGLITAGWIVELIGAALAGAATFILSEATTVTAPPAANK